MPEHPFLKQPDHFIIILRLVREGTVRTLPNPFSADFDIARISRTIFQMIQRTVAKQTVKIRQSLMTGEIFTRLIFKKAI